MGQLVHDDLGWDLLTIRAYKDELILVLAVLSRLLALYSLKFDSSKFRAKFQRCKVILVSTVIFGLVRVDGLTSNSLHYSLAKVKQKQTVKQLY